MKTPRVWLGAAIILGAAINSADAVSLSTGFGDGSLNIEVSLYGSFGTDHNFLSSDGAENGALYDPIGDISAATTVYESYVYAAGPSGRFELDAIASQASIVSQSATQVVTDFSIENFDVRLTQSVSESFDGADRVGSALTQQFVLKNVGDVTSSFDLVRYLDGDLGFDGSINDGGGLTETGGSRILFETDASSAGEASATFVGITSSLSGQNQATLAPNFEIDAFSDLRSSILAGGTLDNDVAGDSDGDGFIDGTYDVTMALQDFVSVLPGETVTYTTNTLFGNAVPEAPGSSEALPLLPDQIGPDGGFDFSIPADVFDTPETIVWIDPEIATGYVYDITGGTFSAVQAPTFGTVPDGDMTYTLSFVGAVSGDVSIEISSGELYFFAFDDQVSTFTLSGIDPALMLDPTDVTAFVTGVGAFTTSSVVNVVQTPISAVPLPAGLLLSMSGVLLLGGMHTRLRRLRTS